MIKTIDIDKLFDKYIEGFVYANIGKIKPEEIEDKIPVLYEEFGNASIKELDGKTPNTFYKEFSAKELLNCLKEHLEKGVPVSDFLCEAITSAENAGEELLNALSCDYSDNGDEFTAYLMNMISDTGTQVPVSRYLEFITGDYPENIGELATEFLCKTAENVKESVLNAYESSSGKGRERIVEILSNIKNDERVFEILVCEFINRKENIPLYSSYLVKYGDPRAIEKLTEVIESDKIKYSDFEELRFAIEALGGEYNKTRDFSSDSTYKKICGVKRPHRVPRA